MAQNMGRTDRQTKKLIKRGRVRTKGMVKGGGRKVMNNILPSAFQLLGIQ